MAYLDEKFKKCIMQLEGAAGHKPTSIQNILEEIYKDQSLHSDTDRQLLVEELCDYLNHPEHVQTLAELDTNQSEVNQNWLTTLQAFKNLPDKKQKQALFKKLSTSC